MTTSALSLVETDEHQSRFKFLSDVQVENLPPIEWLVEGVIPARSLSILYGAPGEGKTFVALDLAFCVATDRSWCGRKVETGIVIHVAAEGASGIGARVRAWKSEHGLTGVAGVLFFPDALHMFREADVSAFINEARSLGPTLVTLDTLARCSTGAEEDSARDMGVFVAAADRIRKALGCAVLVLHHPTKHVKNRKPIERGSGALRGAADVVIRLSRVGDNFINVVCEKQKEGESFKPIRLKLKVVTLEDGATSCVPVFADDDNSISSPALKDSLRESLSALAGFDTSDVRTADWLKAARAKEISARKFYSDQRELEQLGVIEKIAKGRWRATLYGKNVLNAFTATATKLQR
jgi:hypothetical protein